MEALGTTWPTEWATAARTYWGKHYHYLFEGAEQPGRAAIATMLTPGADDPSEATEVA